MFCTFSKSLCRVETWIPLHMHVADTLLQINKLLAKSKAHEQCIKIKQRYITFVMCAQKCWAHMEFSQTGVNVQSMNEWRWWHRSIQQCYNVSVDDVAPTVNLRAKQTQRSDPEISVMTRHSNKYLHLYWSQPPIFLTCPSHLRPAVS